MNSQGIKEHSSGAPVVTGMQVIPVAGRDSMLLNLSGAHGPFFTRNIVILEDNAGNTGVGEVPGGERIRKTLEDAKSLVIGKSIGNYNNILNYGAPAFCRQGFGWARPANLRFADHDPCGDGIGSRIA